MILQQYAKTYKGVEYPMIDRQTPTNSLLVQFSMPPAATAVSHPKVAGYVPPVKESPMLKKVEEWITSLRLPAPSYNVDLSKPPPAAKPAAAPNG